MRARVERIGRGNRLRTAACVALIAASAATASRASAEETAYCRKAQARAASDAALLFAPSVQAQGIRFPAISAIDVGVTVGQGYQARVGLTWSPLDFYKGFRVQDVADADCDRHAAFVDAMDVLSQGADYGKLPALKKQAELLDARRVTWEGIVSQSEERLAAHVASVLEATEIRARAAELERSRLQVRGELERLAARGAPTAPAKLPALVAAVDASAMKYEREVSHVRTLDAWDLRVTGGVAPRNGPVDWFGVVQIGISLGAFSRNAAESRYLSAREEELRSARYELGEQVRRFRAQVRSARDQAKRELASLEGQLARLGADKDALAASEAPNAPHAVAVLQLSAVSLEANRAFLVAYVEELSRLEGMNDGH